MQKNILSVAFFFLIFFDFFILGGEKEFLSFGEKEENNKYIHEKKDFFYISYSISSSLSNLSSKIIDMLERTGYIKCIPAGTFSDKIYIHLTLIEETNKISYKIYSEGKNEFLCGKEFSFKKISDTLLRKIGKSLFIIFFGEANITPFDYFLVTSKSDITIPQNKKRKYSILMESPFGNMYSKSILKTTSHIVDLGVCNTENPFLWYSEMTNKNVRIIKLSSNGSLIPLIDINGTTSSSFVTSNNLEDSFFVSSGKIMRYKYNKKNESIEPVIFIQKDDYIASLCFMNKSLFYTYKGSIYQTVIDLNNKSIKENIKIMYKDAYSISPSINEATNTLIFTSKINGYMQLVLYTLDDKRYYKLTNSKYDKEDPSLSPCGNYVCYMVSKPNDHSCIEIMNINTHAIIKYTDKNAEYRYPCWIKNKIDF